MGRRHYAPTPELDDLRDQLIESIPPGDEGEGYFAGGRVSPGAVERLFTAARALLEMKPWSPRGATTRCRDHRTASAQADSLPLSRSGAPARTKPNPPRVTRYHPAMTGGPAT